MREERERKNRVGDREREMEGKRGRERGGINEMEKDSERRG